MDDMVVVIPGIYGSQLWSGDAPVWALSAGALWQAVRTGAHSIQDLTLPPGLGDDDAPDGVVARGLMPDLHGLPGRGPMVHGYSDLSNWLRDNFTLHAPSSNSPGNFIEFAYDWRLSNRNSANKLKTVVDAELQRWRHAGHPHARLVFLCHSMGGLVARYYLEVLGGAENCKALVTFGSPHRGSAKAAVSMVNGVRVGKGPFKVNVSALGRSLPSAYQLLPTYRCVNTASGRIGLAAAGLKHLDPEMVSDALAFHEEIGRAAESNGPTYLFRMVVGTRQPTFATVDLDGDRVLANNLIDGRNERGDGTVTRFASIPLGVSPEDLRQLSSAQTHGWIHTHQSVLDDVWGILTARDVVYMDEMPDMPLQPGLDVPDLVELGPPIALQAQSSSDELLLWATLTDSDGGAFEPVEMTNEGGGRYSASLVPDQDGVYTIRVFGSPGSGVGVVETAITVADIDESSEDDDV